MFLFNDTVGYTISNLTNALRTGNNVTINNTLMNIPILSESIQLSPEDKFLQAGILGKLPPSNHC